MTQETRPYLPYGRQFIDEDDIQAVAEVLRGDWLTTGPTVERFETEFKAIIRSDYFAVCANGTAALHLACLALNLGPGDKVIVPAISFIATANGARYCGADILFTDVDPDTGLVRASDVWGLMDELSPEDLKSVKAIIPVNLSGEVAEIEAIHDIAQAQGWKMIVDSCHAVGTIYHGKDGQMRTVGDCHFADMEVFSFHPVKTIAMGEGGGISTNDKALYERLCLLRNHGMVRDPAHWDDKAAAEEMQPWYYEMQQLGFNYRESDIHCALGISQLKKLPDFIDKRRKLVACYDKLFANFPNILRPISKVAGCAAARHLYVVLFDFEAAGQSRAEVVRKLAARQVGCQVHYIPIYDHPYYVKLYGRQQREGAALYYARTLSLPLHVNMTSEDVSYVVGQLSAILNDG